MKTLRQSLVTGMIFVFLVGTSGTLFIAMQPRVTAYTPTIGNSTEYDYGFVSIQSNLTASQISHWTGLSLSAGNYTLRWQQHVNLTISVMNVAQVGLMLEALYNFTVNIFGNVASVSNASWQTTETFNDSVSAPAPTGITSGLYIYPTIDGVPGFFLDDGTLAGIIVGTNVIIGNGLWQEIDYTTLSFQGSEQVCYQLFNSSSTPQEFQETTFVIDHDVGIYYQANDTRILSIDTIQQSLTYYYQVLTTNISLEPIPSLLPFLLIIGVAIIVPIIIVIMVVRMLWRRRSQE